MKKQLLGVFAAAGLALGSLGVVGCGSGTGAGVPDLDKMISGPKATADYAFHWTCTYTVNGGQDKIGFALFDDHSLLITEGSEKNEVGTWKEVGSNLVLDLTYDEDAVELSNINWTVDGAQFSCVAEDLNISKSTPEVYPDTVCTKTNSSI